MATYAIGDIQGCWQELKKLLKKVDFGKKDELWLCGDLVNRGPESLAVLRFLRDLDGRCKIALGNHDLHFLAILFGGHQPTPKDTLDELLAAPEVEELGHWLRQQRLLYRERDHILVHAGVPPKWGAKQAEAYADEVTAVMGGKKARSKKGALGFADFFRDLYGNEPPLWDQSLTGMTRLRTIVNYLTRMRMIDNRGALNFMYKGALADAPQNLSAWFDNPSAAERRHKILFGHWASLNGETGNGQCVALDTGCVWGRELTAYCLETGERSVQSALG